MQFELFRYTKHMKKIIFGIFAHPDDEAFGPAGTLLLETRSGTELHLVILTPGDAGANPDAVSDLGAIRLDEWHEAGRLLGAASMHALGYKDGTLNNKDMVEISQKLTDVITPILQSAPEDTVVEFMTLDLNGYTGHIDHIVAARAASYVFYTLKQTYPRLERIRYACLPQKLFPIQNTDWIFMEAGRSPQEVTEIVDARSLRDDIIQIMQTHHSQRADYEYNLAKQGDDLGLNYFIIRS
jgi:N-acetylglucosamine malate deacetylase 2